MARWNASSRAAGGSTDIRVGGARSASHRGDYIGLFSRRAVAGSAEASSFFSRAVWA